MVLDMVEAELVPELLDLVALLVLLKDGIENAGERRVGGDLEGRRGHRGRGR